MALLMVVGGVVLVGRVADGVRTSASASPTPSPTPPVSRVGEPRDLFAGSPAASFAPAEEAVRMPAAKSTGPFTAAQVRTALESVRKALIESRVDISMFSGDPEPFLALLAPHSREPLRGDFANWQLPAVRHEDGVTVGVGVRRARRRPGQLPGHQAERRPTAGGLHGVRLGVPVRRGLRRPPARQWCATRPGVWAVPHPDDVPTSAVASVSSAEAVTWNADCAQLRESWVQEQFWVADVHRDRIPAGRPGHHLRPRRARADHHALLTGGPRPVSGPRR